VAVVVAAAAVVLAVQHGMLQVVVALLHDVAAAEEVGRHRQLQAEAVETCRPSVLLVVAVVVGIPAAGLVALAAAGIPCWPCLG